MVEFRLLGGRDFFSVYGQYLRENKPQRNMIESPGGMCFISTYFIWEKRLSEDFR